MQLTEKRLRDLSDIEARYFTVPMPSSHYLQVLVVSFQGGYRYGGEGNPDARYMEAITRAGLAAWSSSGIILDLRGLQYEWGDLIRKALFAADGRYPGAEFPTAVVTSELNAPALLSLLRDYIDCDPDKYLFESMEDALDDIDHRHNRLIESFGQPSDGSDATGDSEGREE